MDTSHVDTATVVLSIASAFGTFLLAMIPFFKILSAKTATKIDDKIVEALESVHEKTSMLETRTANIEDLVDRPSLPRRIP